MAPKRKASLENSKVSSQAPSASAVAVAALPKAPPKPKARTCVSNPLPISGEGVQTRSKNADTRLVPEEPTKRKRCTAAQKKADDEAEAEAAKAAEKQQQESIRGLAAMESEIRQNDLNMSTPRPRAPPKLSRTTTYLEIPLTNEGNDVHMQDGTAEPSSEFQVEESAEEEATPPAKKLKVVKLAKAKVVGVRLEEPEEEPPATKKPRGKMDVRSLTNAERVKIDGRVEHDTDDQGSVNQKEAPKGANSATFVFTPFTLTTYMLTLDATTLFYFSRYSSNVQEPKRLTGAIHKWAADVTGSRPSAGSSKTSSTLSQISSTVNSANGKSSNRTLTTSSLSKTVAISSYNKQKPPSIVKVEDDFEDEVLGGLSDVDETQGAERDEAALSPVKGYQHIDSKAIVNIDETPRKPVSCHTGKTTGKITNNDLPVGALDNNHWLHTLILTMIQFMAVQDNPWTIGNVDFRAALQMVWDAIYKKSVPHKVVHNDPVFRLCQQRLSQWRNKMGSAGLVIVNSLLNSIDVNEPENNLDTNEKRQDYCQDLLDDLKFVWAEWVSKEDHKGLFASPLIIHTLASYFVAIEGAVQVPKLEGVDLANPYGALALAVVSVERALTLWATGTITIEIVEAVKANKANRGEVLMRELNKAVSEDVGFKFDENLWGTATEGYSESAAKLRKKAFTSIIADAKEIAKKTQRGSSHSSRSAGPSTTSHAKASKDQRALLIDISEDGE